MFAGTAIADPRLSLIVSVHATPPGGSCASVTVAEPLAPVPPPELVAWPAQLPESDCAYPTPPGAFASVIVTVAEALALAGDALPLT